MLRVSQTEARTFQCYIVPAIRYPAPTETTSLSFIGASSRTDLRRSEWNRELFQCIAQAYCDLLSETLKELPDGSGILRYWPYMTDRMTEEISKILPPILFPKLAEMQIYFTGQFLSDVLSLIIL